MRLWHFFSLGFILSNSFFGSGQNERISEKLYFNNIKNYNTSNGLPSNNVYHLLQSDKGLLWLGTDRGVSIFDGQEFRNFGVKDGLSDYEILSSYQDSDGLIWFASFNGKLSYYSKGQFSRIDLSEGATDGGPIRSFLDLGSEKILVRNRGDGLVYGGMSKPEALAIDTGQYRTILVEEYRTSGKFLTVSANDRLRGQVKISLGAESVFKNGVYTSTGFYDEKNKLFLINSIDEDILIEEIELPSLETSSLKILKELKGERPLSITIEDNLLLIGTRAGLYIYEWVETDEILRFVANDFEENSVTSISKIQDGSWWISTLDNGLFQFNLEKERSKIYDHPVFRIVESRGRLFACGLGEFIEIDLSENNHDWIKLKQKEKITDIEVLEDGQLLISSGVGLFKYRAGMIEEYTFGSGLKDITSINDYYYVGAYNGLYEFKSENLKDLDFIPRKIFEDRSNTVYAENGFVYAGNGEGLKKIDLSTGKSISFFDSFQGRVNRVSVSEGAVWFGTLGEGIYRIKDAEEINYFENSTSHSFYVSEDGCWTVTNDGLGYVSNDKEIDYQSSELGVSGKIEDVFNANGELLIASSEGLYSKKVDDLESQSRQFLADVYFTEILVNGENFEIENAALDYDQNNIEINYSAVCFTNETPVEYSYELYNEQDGSRFSSRTTNNQLSFFDLNPGQYTFKIHALVKDTEGKGLVFDFAINKPFYKETWFLFLTAIIVLGGIIVALLIRMSRYRKEKKIQEELYEYEQQALRAKMNPHFLFNVLNSIQQFFLKDDGLSGHKYLKKFAELVRIVLNSTDKTYVSIQKEIDYLSRYVELEQLRANIPFEFVIDVQDEIEITDTYVPSMTIQPFIENSIWHAFDQNVLEPKIHLSFILNDSHLEVSVKDNGKGFSISKNEEDRDHGIMIVRERLDLLKKRYDAKFELSLKSEIGKGTEIKLITPLTYD